MQPEDFTRIRTEMNRLDERMRAFEVRCKKPYFKKMHNLGIGSRESGAVRRAMLDLSMELSKFRNNSRG